MAEATFPTQEEKVLHPQEHVIRLITRLLFVWFLKEKGLVADDLFNETKIAALLKKYDCDSGDSYYRAVLQNLFFATLNTETDKRGFSKTRNSTHRNFSLHRYKKEIADPAALVDLFAQTPFINGGLFDCLDSEEGIRDGGYRIDCFSDNARHYTKLSLPNGLFFDEQRGVFPLLKHYKFTVEENTPVEQEVALDPELLGKVFENLLAAYNPETRDTARKQTGSYYTPRAVVDYMVDEALLASLAQKCRPTDGDAKFWQERLRYLLNYEDAFSDADELFDADEAHGIVRAIADLKVLDPAVGSGAFPMGVLHKLTLALGRIDPDNTRWQALQKERARQRADTAFETKDQQERDAELLEVSEIFEKYSGDFGRKLYLIQNSIFGVDIQPIACQIAKLRFFISLAIEQEPDREANNFGIRPLPNLETRFIAADTLLHLETADQLDLFRQQIEALKTKLVENRERHFHATTRRKKLACKAADKQLRTALSEALQSAGLPEDNANKIAQWDPYDQNAKADWFDAEYMFGNRDGFDVAIGNPPYVQLQKDGGALRKLYKDAGFETLAPTGDVYQLFYEKGCQLLTPSSGLLAYITSNKWMRSGYGEKTRAFLATKTNLLQLLDFGGFQVFENATVDTNILITQNTEPQNQLSATKIKNDFSKKDSISDYVTNNAVAMTVTPDTWFVGSKVEMMLKEKIELRGTPLKEWDITIYRGVTTGCNDAFIIDTPTKEALISEDLNSAEIIKPILRGQDIKRYASEWAGLYLIATFPSLGVDIDNYPAVKKHLLAFGKDRLEQNGKALADGGKSRKKTRHLWFESQDATAYHEDFTKEKIIWAELSRSGNSFHYDKNTMFLLNTSYLMTGKSLYYLLGLLNSKTVLYYLDTINQKLDNTGWRWLNHYVERLPIPQIPAAKHRPFIRLVDRILEAKNADPKADTDEMEAEIDRLVYGLYGLTEGEIDVVEGRR